MLFISIFYIILQLCVINSLENQDICQSYGSKIYFHANDFGIIEAKNIINNSTTNKITVQECNVELITCPSCAIVVNFTFLNVSHRCKQYNPFSECNCEYIQIMEHPYELLSAKKICGSDIVDGIFQYQSLTRNLLIKLFYVYDDNISFFATYKSINNRIILPETNSPAFFTSPFFPSFYLEDLIIEYVVTCPKSIFDNCQVQLIFSDFQIAPMSIMEFLDWDGERIDIITGVNFRPPTIISTGPTIFIRFYAYGGTGLGYRAQYTFVSNETEYSDYNTDCGGLVDNLGGGITMMDMVETGNKKFFCFWILKPSTTYSPFKTYLYLKIINFENMENTSELIIHKTTTSSGDILQIHHSSITNNKTAILSELIEPVETGFYISFKGVFGVKSRLAVVYAAFSYKECFTESNFLCANHRCIPNYLTCDGFDHCGDNSDETVVCSEDSNTEPIDRSWYSKTPNYFFPKIDPYSDLKTTSLILVMTSFGLISLVSALFFLLYKINGRSGHDNDIQNHLQIISDILEEDILDIESIQDEPPIYEAPPDYDEIIKIEFDANATLTKSKKKRKRTRSIKSRKSQISETDVPEVPTNLPPNYNDSCHSKNFQLPSTSAIPLPIPIMDVEKIKNKITGKYSRFDISDRSVKSKLKRKWHSYDEKNFDLHVNVKLNKKRINLFKPLAKVEITKIKHFRKTASDSDLLKLGSCDNVLFF